jgi:hypothetical protein
MEKLDGLQYSFLSSNPESRPLLLAIQISKSLAAFREVEDRYAREGIAEFRGREKVFK